jgi:sulfoxide reductase heme-binding subunit YedZ
MSSMRIWWQRLGRLLAALANWKYFKPAVFVACAIPAAWLAFDFCQVLLWNHPDALGVDPVKTLEHETGEDALGVLFISLAVTPVRRLFGVNRVQIVRRMLGVWSFFYACVHVLVYLTTDRACITFAGCQYGEIWTDLLKRKFIFVGMVAFTILLALAITSTNGWMRRLRKNWIRLHRLVYVAGIAAVVHYVWGQKSDISEPLKWAGYLVVLLGIRVYFWSQKRASGARTPSPRPQAAT